MKNDVQHLRHQGLIEQRSIEGHESYSNQVLALTKEGHKLLSRQNMIPDRQTIYHGFVKPKEARHDADLYRLYHKVVSAGLRGSHFRRFEGGPDNAAASSEHTRASAAASEQAVLDSSFFPAT
ncbi:MAG TPA: hypothetical protein VK937_23555 [Candidatus Limnocylindria bacterium]|jgi:hypothetical protein|nr:hypothetical protein [Candidatus Limnocylindria bacterium]